MWKRLELHNHTTQSDASISCEELIELMEKDHVNAFALTDHNTISGHELVRKLLQTRSSKLQCIYGMEYTTYYGHILCLNLHRYVPWDTIDRNKPERLFEACKAAGALTGIAHPFSYGDPFARGCRFEMTITDFSLVDFIEIFNNSEPLHEVNENGLMWWENLILSGEHPAITCGMDLHGARSMEMQFTTYIDGEPDGDIENELANAIHAQHTWISKGPLLVWERDSSAHVFRFTVKDTHKPGFLRAGSGPYQMTLRDASGVRTFPITENLCLPENEVLRTDIVIPKLYDEKTMIEQMVCVAPVIYS